MSDEIAQLTAWSHGQRYFFKVYNDRLTIQRAHEREVLVQRDLHQGVDMLDGLTNQQADEFAAYALYQDGEWDLDFLSMFIDHYESGKLDLS